MRQATIRLDRPDIRVRSRWWRARPAAALELTAAGLFPYVAGVKKQTEFQRRQFFIVLEERSLLTGLVLLFAVPFDCCALSLQPFVSPVAVREADGTANVFDLINILPYIKSHSLFVSAESNGGSLTPLLLALSRRVRDQCVVTVSPGHERKLTNDAAI